ncbi:MAG: adenine phosphoribosyltransferase [Candidatus Hydrogenedentales bacterium]|jgi:adenine phosphoribosyltransferase
MDLASLIRNIPDHPKAGVQFKDITTLLIQPKALQEVISRFKKRYCDQQLDAIVGVEARGFIFGTALAYAMELPFIPARKPGKLPAATIQESFQLEYGTDSIEIHTDSIQKGQRILIVDDLLATGGTVAATQRLVQRLGGDVIEAAFVIELPQLKGRAALAPLSVFSLLQFDDP